MIASAATDEPLPQRSGAQWSLIGACSMVALSFPLSMLGLWCSRALVALLRTRDELDQSGGLIRLATLLPILAAFSIAAYIGGLIVARWGGYTASPRLALVGASGGAVVATLAVAAGALRPWQIGAVAYVTLIGVGAASAAGAALFGREARNTATLKRVSQPGVAAPTTSRGEGTSRHEPNR